MKNFLIHCFTGKDNQTFDIGRLLWATGVIVFLVYGGWHVIRNHQFDPLAFGSGLGAALAGGGLGVGFKKDTEPCSHS